MERCLVGNQLACNRHANNSNKRSCKWEPLFVVEPPGEQVMVSAACSELPTVSFLRCSTNMYAPVEFVGGTSTEKDRSHMLIVTVAPLLNCVMFALNK